VGEAADVPHDGRHAVDAVEALFDELAPLRQGLGVGLVFELAEQGAECAEVRAHEGDGVVDLMGHARGQLTYGGHAAGGHEPLSESRDLALVGDREHESDGRILLVAQQRGRHRHRQHLPRAAAKQAGVVHGGFERVQLDAE